MLFLRYLAVLIDFLYSIYTLSYYTIMNHWQAFLYLIVLTAFNYVYLCMRAIVFPSVYNWSSHFPLSFSLFSIFFLLFLFYSFYSFLSIFQFFFRFSLTLAIFLISKFFFLLFSLLNIFPHLSYFFWIISLLKCSIPLFFFLFFSLGEIKIFLPLKGFSFL